MSVKVTKEQMEQEMILNTKKSIYELGIEHTLKKIENDNVKNKIKNVKNKIFSSVSLPENNYIQVLDKYTNDEWMKLFNNFNMYYSDDKKELLYNFYYILNNIENKNLKLIKEIKLLKENIEDLNDEATITIEELNNYEAINKKINLENQQIFKNFKIFQFILYITSSFIFLQNVNIFYYICELYFKIFTYLVTRNIIDTDYQYFNLCTLFLIHYFSYYIYCFLNEKYNIKCKIINIYIKCKNSYQNKDINKPDNSESDNEENFKNK